MTNSTLYVVATPIGHLADITLRAIDTLKQVDYIACEDTREAKTLLTHYDIHTPLLTYHAQSSLGQEEKVLSLLSQGHSIALICDRGTPGVSDPGTRLIQRAIAAGIHVVPIPGASAVITALQASGARTKSFVFLGYVPHKKGRQTFLQNAIAQQYTTVFYESPHRILKCLEQLIEYGIADRHMIIGRELTKQYEEFLRGSCTEVLHELQSRQKIQGEFVVILDALQD